MSALKSQRDLSKADDHELIAAARRHMFRPSGVPLTLHQLADVLGVTARQLSAAFRRSWGMSITDFVRGERMRIAQRLLLQSSLTVQAIAAQLGFSSAANFSSAFRQHTGMPPSEFRKRSPLSELLTTESDIKWGDDPA